MTTTSTNTRSMLSNFFNAERESRVANLKGKQELTRRDSFSTIETFPLSEHSRASFEDSLRSEDDSFHPVHITPIEESDDNASFAFDYDVEDVTENDLAEIKTSTTQSSSPSQQLKSCFKTNPESRRLHFCHQRIVEVNLPCQSKPVKRRRCISFCERAEIKRITPLPSMVDNISELWLQGNDFDKIMKRSERVIDMVEDGYTGLCTRGLEHFMPNGDFNERIETVVDAVLDEQEEQFDKFEFDEYTIAKLSSVVSCLCKAEARKRAEQDAKAVQFYLRDTRRSI